MRCSICLSTFNRPQALARTLASIFAQSVPFSYEVIVIDDGSEGTDTSKVCNSYPVCYERIEREPVYRNPSVARNIAYRKAQGNVVICQSDDVIHYSANCVEQLVTTLNSGQFVIATVFNVDSQGHFYSDPNGQGYGDSLTEYTSPRRKRPLFFLGSLWREDLYAAGGNDEEFVEPSREDVWFAKCLICGLGLHPVYSAEIIGHHQHHPHCTDYAAIKRSHDLFATKIGQAHSGTRPWQASGGSW